MQRRMRTLHNLQKFSYARGHTYCFDLEETFPRVEGHPSYALDEHNAFNHTFSQEGREFGGSKLGQLMNRKLFGLPYTEHDQKRREANTKNICHAHLFDNEDKKYHMDRKIYTVRRMGKDFDRMVEEVRRFKVVRNDTELDELFEE